MTRPIVRCWLLTILLSLLPAAWPSALHAAPEPSIVPRAWEFDFTFQAPRPIAIRDIDGQYHWFWYMTYKVVNNSGTEQMFIPEFTIATDTGKIIAAGSKLPSSLFPAIKAKLQNPLLLSPVDVVGRLLQGEDNARESVAVWPAFEDDVDAISVFVGGLSGETIALPHPLTGDPVLLRKTMKVDYAMPGSSGTPQVQPMLMRSSEWVMR